jgi:mannose-6-phosphate isomerase-like protein (cupin superfamily)
MSGDTTAALSAPHFRPILTDTGNGPSFTMLGTTMRLIATAADTGGRFTVGEQVTPAGWGPPRHIHSREDEIFYILEGTYELHVGDGRRTVSAGACAILAPRRSTRLSQRGVHARPLAVRVARQTQGIRSLSKSISLTAGNIVLV